MAANSAAEKPSFRWLDLARYVVASVVTVLIVAVICNAIKVILRPETMYVSVPGGSVPATAISSDSPPPPPSSATPTPAPRVAFAINLRTQNPSGRAVMYYVNSTVYLFDKNTTESTTNPKDDSIVYFHVNDVALLQGGAVDSILRVSATKAQMIPSYFDLLHDGNNGSSNQIAGVTLRLDGVLITEAVSGSNRTGRPTTYYCRELLVGGDPDDEAFKGRPDVTCSGVMQASSSSSTSHNHVLSWLFYYMLVASMVALIHQTL